MAIDLRSLDKKKLISVVVAITLALIVVVLTNNYIEENSQKRAKELTGGLTSAEMKKLVGRLDILEKANQEIMVRQNAATQEKAQPPKPPAAQSLAVKTPVGKRAITAIIDKLFAVGGMISPGDHVDVITHMAIPSDPKDPQKTDIITLTLFQDVLVLAVGNNLQPGTGYEAQQNATSIQVTLALNPQEAGLISFVQQHGSLQLMLRPPLDTNAYLLPPATWDSLSEYIMATQGSDSVLKKQERSKSQIEIYRGGGS